MWKDCLSIQLKVQTVEENDNILNYSNLKKSRDFSKLKHLFSFKFYFKFLFKSKTNKKINPTVFLKQYTENKAGIEIKKTLSKKKQTQGSML